MRGFCQRCGFRRTDLRKEWTALLVCSPCWDPKPADMSPPRLNPNEGAPNKETAPEPEDEFVVIDIGTGSIVPSLDFSLAANSQYTAII